ncbi:hypothetical protein N7456_000377 [Penicillium angulare]|uniref:Uncharacterized protein n=1 Tax=Penicillium angulare TaxID=116970 RepID=A0A9W9KS63_9EURO|nr:hypothetical protein N7456_000377 [Penicillium angulare]
MEGQLSTSSHPSVKPAQLLWSYEHLRTNKALTSALLDAKTAYDESAELVACLFRCLNDCVIIAFSIAQFKKEAPDGSPSHTRQLDILQRQSKRALESLKTYSTLTEAKGKILTACVTELERLCNNPVEASNTPEPTEVELKERIQKSMSAPKPTFLVLRERNTTSPTVKSESESTSEAIIQSVTDHVTPMDQRDRSLEQYFEAAKKTYYSQCKHPESIRFLPRVIRAFIDGLDKKIYRRRIVHAMRKEGWNWGTLENMVEFIVLEEEYFKQQAYAVDHEQEDGSVLLPDGTKQNLFIVLEPISDQDLTESEGE